MDTKESTTIEIYESSDGDVSFNVPVFDETVWLNRQQLSTLFDRDIKTIGKHINNIFKESELDKKSVVAFFATSAADGKIYKVEHYNLDVAISVGYRVKSQRGTQFRQWATKVLKQYMLNGYSINEPRIRKIEASIEELIESHKLHKEDAKRIENLLVKLIEKPIEIHNNHHHTINNNMQLGSNEMEQKLIELLDVVINSINKDTKTKAQIEQIKEDLENLPGDAKTKKRIIEFFKRVGDSESSLNKTIQNAGVAKDVISELVKLWDKVKVFLITFQQ